MEDSGNKYRPVCKLHPPSKWNEADWISDSTDNPLLYRPFPAPLLFPNESSDARDHCANERTFLSWLRLSVYMSVVSAAIILSFHLKSEPTSIERRIALPVGLIFWVLSLGCLISGLGNYLKTVKQYAHRRALVQSGWKTQVVRFLLYLKGRERSWVVKVDANHSDRFSQLLHAPSWQLAYYFSQRTLHQAGDPMMQDLATMKDRNHDMAP